LQTVPHTVTVTDNGSPDDTPGKTRASFPEVTVVEMGANLGFPIACNRGVASGTGEIVVLLNNDVEAEPQFLERLIRPFEDEAVGSASPLLVRPGGEEIDCLGITADRTLAGFSRLKGHPVQEASAPSHTLVGPLGAAGAYRRTAWEAVGGLDEGVFFYGEDTDLAIRICAAGWRTVAVPEARAVHVGSASAGHRSSWQRYHGGFGRGYFVERFRLLRTTVAPRIIATELFVVVADAMINRDLSAFRGRLAGWRAARHLPPRMRPPSGVLDTSIGFLESLRLRRAVYTSQPSTEHVA
jgi:GT2 family glycosyltransferase